MCFKASPTTPKHTLKNLRLLHMLLEASRIFCPGATSALSQHPHGGERPEQTANIREGKGSSVGSCCHHQALLPAGPGYDFWKGRRPQLTLLSLCCSGNMTRELTSARGFPKDPSDMGAFSGAHTRLHWLLSPKQSQHIAGQFPGQTATGCPCGGVPTCLSSASVGKQLGMFPAHDHTVALKSCNAESWRSTHHTVLIWRPFISNTIRLLCCFKNILPKYMFNAAQLQKTNTRYVRDPMVNWKRTHIQFLQYVSYNRVWASYTLSKSLCNETLVKGSKTLF